LLQPEVSRKFHFLREIASGGFGSVFLAKVIHSDGFSRLAAIKLLHPKWSENEEIASRMRDEARLLGQLRHRNIVDVLDLTMIDGRVAVIMEYLEAVDLRTIITDAVDHGELLPTRVTLEVAGCVASALDAAFNRPPIPGEKPLRVIHRDIKPTNVMVDESGTPKVLDFGVARADFEERESHTQDVAFGSIEYMPPERLFFEPESPASDVYSLGATFFELLAVEKFGKAKLRPNQHDELIFKRLRYLFGRNKVGDQEVRNAVKVLLRDMLAFDEADRPTSAEVVERTRAITRMIRKEETLAEWAEVMIPPLIEAQRNRQQEGTPNPLVDQVLEEDSYGFRRTPTEELFSDRTIPPDDDMDFESPAPDDDARWAALKQATLAEITAANAPPPVPVGMRSVAPGAARKSDIATATPAPIRRTEPAPPPPPERPPARGSRRLLLGVLALGALVVMVGLVAAVGVGIGVSAGALSTGGISIPGVELPAVEGGEEEAPPAPAAETVVETPADPGVVAETAPQAEAPAPEPEEAAPVPEGPVVTFLSGMENPKKLSVRCDGGGAEGVERVVLGLTGLGACTVTGIGHDRTRLTAVIQDVKEGDYLCFESGEKKCEISSSGGK